MHKVLLIEDDEFMIRMYQRVFKLEGYDVEIAGDGQEGYDKVCSFQPDIALIDIMMPRMNGLQALEKIKGNPKTKNITIYMLTNLANQSDAEAALKMGADKYLIKSNYDAKAIVGFVNVYFAEKNKQ